MPPQHVRALLDLFPVALRGSAWLLEWLATYAIHSTILIAAAWLVSSGALGRRLRLTQAAPLWRFAMLGGLVTATLSAAGALGPATRTLHLGLGTPARAAYRVFVRSDGDVPPILTTRIEIHPVWPLVAASLWVGAAALSLALLALAHRSLMRSLEPGGLHHGSLAENALGEVKRKAGIDRAIRLSVAGHLASPVAIGRRHIGLPARALAEFDLAHLESILAHELAHLERWDGAWLLIARVIEAVFFFQPLNRLARRRVVEAAEFGADAWAVRVTERPVVLARCLARVAEWSIAAPALLAPAMVERGSSALVRRVRRLVAQDTDGAPAAPTLMLALAAMASLVVLAPRAAVGGVTHHAGARRVIVWAARKESAALRPTSMTSGSNIVILRLPR